MQAKPTFGRPNLLAALVAAGLIAGAGVAAPTYTSHQYRGGRAVTRPPEAVSRRRRRFLEIFRRPVEPLEVEPCQSMMW